MASPDIAASNYSADGAAGTSHSASMTGVSAGHKAILLAGHGVIATDAPDISGMPTGWELREKHWNTTNGACSLHCWEKPVCDGTETDFSFNTSASVRMGIRILLVSGGTTDDLIIATAEGAASSNIDPPSATTGESAEDILVIECAIQGRAESAISASTNYVDDNESDSISDLAAGSTNAIASRSLNADGDNPGTMATSSTRSWVASTIIIRPAAEGASSSPSTSASSSPSTSPSSSPSASASSSPSTSPSPSSSVSASPSTSPSTSPSSSPSAGDDEIACTDLTADRVYQRVAGGTTKTITFAGTYVGDAPASVEVKIVNQSDASTVQDYAALSSATIAGGNWSGTLSVPQGGWYNFLARSKDGGGSVLAISSQTANKWGVGVLVAMIGQSNMLRMTSVSSSPPASSDLTRQYTSSWAVVAGNGAIRFANTLQATLGLPVGVLPFAESGTDIAGWASGSTYNNFATGLTAVGGDCEFVLWHQGEADIQAATAGSTYKTALGTLYARVRTSTGRSTTTLKFGSAIVGRLDTGGGEPADAQATAIRTAQRDWCDETTGAFHAGSSVDMALADTVHWAAAAYERMGRRYAQAILHQLGLVSHGSRGPRIVSARRDTGSAVMRLTIFHLGGTALEEADGTTDGGSLTGLQFSDDDFATTLTISSTAFSGGQVHVTLSAAPADEDVVKVRYQYGEEPTVTNAIYDDTTPGSDTLGLPVQPTTDPITVSLSSSSSPLEYFPMFLCQQE